MRSKETDGRVRNTRETLRFHLKSKNIKHLSTSKHNFESKTYGNWIILNPMENNGNYLYPTRLLCNQLTIGK